MGRAFPRTSHSSACSYCFPLGSPLSHHYWCHHRRWRVGKYIPGVLLLACHQHQWAADLATVNVGLCYPLPLIKTTSKSKKKDEVWVQGGKRKSLTQWSVVPLHFQANTRLKHSAGLQPSCWQSLTKKQPKARCSHLSHPSKCKCCAQCCLSGATLHEHSFPFPVLNGSDFTDTSAVASQLLPPQGTGFTEQMKTSTPSWQGETLPCRKKIPDLYGHQSRPVLLVLENAVKYYLTGICCNNCTSPVTQDSLSAEAFLMFLQGFIFYLLFGHWSLPFINNFHSSVSPILISWRWQGVK